MKFILSYKVQDRPEIPLTVSQKTDKGLERWLRAWLRAFAGFAEGLGLVASTYMDGSSQQSLTPVPRDQIPHSDLQRH